MRLWIAAPLAFTLLVHPCYCGWWNWDWMDPSSSSTTSTSSSESDSYEYYSSWSGYEDNSDWEEIDWDNGDDDDDGGARQSSALTGAGVCSHSTLELVYYYENVSFPCWDWFEVACETRRDQSRSRQQDRTCYQYECRTCNEKVRKCGYKTVQMKYCCRGYEDDGQGQCREIIECGNDNGGCNQLCNADSGNKHHCSCFPGYEPVNTTHCIDKNECTNGESSCDQSCHNTDGSHVCRCQPGYALMGPNKCEDINECSFAAGGCEHECVNTDGAFYCLCQPGYTLQQGFMCNDTDECQFFNGGCSHECKNTIGSYKCMCPEERGFVLGENEKTCISLNGDNEGVIFPDSLPPDDLPLVASGEESSSSAGLIAGLIVGLLLLAILVLAAVLLARRCGYCTCCCCPFFAAAAATSGPYETAIPIGSKKGLDLDKDHPNSGYNNNAYSTHNDMLARNVHPPPAPPAYSIAGPIDNEYTYPVDPPHYDNIDDEGIHGKNVPVVGAKNAIYDNMEEGYYEDVVAMPVAGSPPAFDNKTYQQISQDNIVNIKNALKPTGVKLA